MTDTLIVMLPGALMQPAEYASAGFAASLATAWPEAKLLVLAINIDQLDVAASITVLRTRLQEIIAEHHPCTLILGGISMGAAMALHYVRQYPEGIAGLCLLAPYPASRITTQAIRDAGGTSVWQINEQQRQDAEFVLWDWLIHARLKPPVYIGYGSDDRFASGISMLAATLPKAVTHCVEGGHDWPSWQLLWQNFVTRSAHFTTPTAVGEE